MILFGSHQFGDLRIFREKNQATLVALESSSIAVPLHYGNDSSLEEWFYTFFGLHPFDTDKNL